MKTYDKLATRLSIIINRLNDGELFTLNSLSEEFNVDIRTIQRDLNQRLSFLDICKNEHKEYYLKSNKFDKKNVLDIQKFAQLSGIKELYPTLDSGFLKNILEYSNETYLVKSNKYESIDKKIFFDLEKAISSHYIVTFDYKDKKRFCSPYKLINIKDIWYLCGVENKILKNFTLKKIENLKIEKEEFYIDEAILQKVEDEKALWFGTKKREIILKVDKEVVYYFTRQDILPQQKTIKILENGDMLLASTIFYEKEILAIIRYWIPHIKIISPDDLHTKLLESLEIYIKDKK